MNIALIDIDGHNFPNLPLMKLSAYHKNRGDNVEWYIDLMEETYDKIYASKVFTYTLDKIYPKRTIKGGTGYNLFNELSGKIEHIYPDYDLYNIKNVAYGFLTRGCSNKCSWCIVPKKEGNIRANADITEFWNGQKKVFW